MEQLRSLEAAEETDCESQPAAESKQWKGSPVIRENTGLSKLGAKSSMHGNTHFDEAKEKLRRADLGREPTPAIKGKTNRTHLGKKFSPETRAKISSSKLGQKHSEETKAKLSVANSKEKHPCWDQNIAAIQQAIILHTNGMSKRQASLQIGFSGNWLANWQLRHPLRSRDLCEGPMAVEESELRQARSVYARLDYSDDNKVLLALYYGFGIYRRHSYHHIGSICGKDQVWAIRSLEQIMAGQRPPAHSLRFEITADSRQPLFLIDSRFSARQLQKLADILPSLDRMAMEIAVSLFGLGGRPPETVAEINGRLFQSAIWGEQKIKNTKRLLEDCMFAA